MCAWIVSFSDWSRVVSMCTWNGKEDCKRNILGPANPQAPEQGWGMCSMDEVKLEPFTGGFYLLELFMSFSLQKTANSGWFCINWEISKNHCWCNKCTNSSFLSGARVSLTLVGVSKDCHCLVGCWKDPKNKEKKIRTEEGMNGYGWISARKFHTKKNKHKGAAVSSINQPVFSS